jgi:diguanylate cyclase (GGDEF)-like protein
MITAKNSLFRKHLHYLFILVGSFIYIYLSLWLQKHTGDSPVHSIWGVEVKTPIINGAITQFQLLIIVLMVLLGEKISFVTALILSVFNLVGALIYTIRTGSIDSVPGILSFVGAGIIIMMIFTYKNRLSGQLAQLRDQEFELRELAMFDGLTGALNRKSFIEELNKQIDICREHDRKIYVAFLDIDDFKNINDTIGHHAGDQILQALSSRIKNVLHASDIIGRLGGDEIGLIIRNDADENRINDCLYAVHAAALQPHFIDNKQIESTISLGAAAYPTDGTSAEELLKKADLAMYEAKNNGKSRICFYDELEEIKMEASI